MKKIFRKINYAVLIAFFSVGTLAVASAQSSNFNYSSNQSSSANSNSNTNISYNGYGGYGGWGSWGNPWNGWGGGWGGYNNDTAPNNCKVWYDGCNTCSRQYPGGPLVCTKLACFAKGQSYCKEYFYNNNGWGGYGWGGWNTWNYPWWYYRH